MIKLKTNKTFTEQQKTIRNKKKKDQIEKNNNISLIRNEG